MKTINYILILVLSCFLLPSHGWSAEETVLFNAPGTQLNPEEAHWHQASGDQPAQSKLIYTKFDPETNVQQVFMFDVANNREFKLTDSPLQKTDADWGLYFTRLITTINRNPPNHFVGKMEEITTWTIVYAAGVSNDPNNPCAHGCNIMIKPIGDNLNDLGTLTDARNMYPEKPLTSTRNLEGNDIESDRKPRMNFHYVPLAEGVDPIQHQVPHLIFVRFQDKAYEKTRPNMIYGIALNNNSVVNPQVFNLTYNYSGECVSDNLEENTRYPLADFDNPQWFPDGHAIIFQAKIRPDNEDETTYSHIGGLIEYQPTNGCLPHDENTITLITNQMGLAHQLVNHVRPQVLQHDTAHLNDVDLALPRQYVVIYHLENNVNNSIRYSLGSFITAPALHNFHFVHHEQFLVFDNNQNTVNRRRPVFSNIQPLMVRGEGGNSHVPIWIAYERQEDNGPWQIYGTEIKVAPQWGMGMNFNNQPQYLLAQEMLDLFDLLFIPLAWAQENKPVIDTTEPPFRLELSDISNKLNMINNANGMTFALERVEGLSAHTAERLKNFVKNPSNNFYITDLKLDNNLALKAYSANVLEKAVVNNNELIFIGQEKIFEKVVEMKAAPQENQFAAAEFGFQGGVGAIVRAIALTEHQWTGCEGDHVYPEFNWANLGIAEGDRVPDLVYTKLVSNPASRELVHLKDLPTEFNGSCGLVEEECNRENGLRLWNPDIERDQDADRDGIEDRCDACLDHFDLQPVHSPKDCPVEETQTCADLGLAVIGDREDNGLDADEDGIPDACDNCLTVANNDQGDNDEDGLGNMCDNCLGEKNPNQEDSDQDGLGNVCDPCPNSILAPNDKGICGPDTIIPPPDPDPAFNPLAWGSAIFGSKCSLDRSQNSLGINSLTTFFTLFLLVTTLFMVRRSHVKARRKDSIS